jgi:glycosyltransferase involved in cell wall biosynthesis
MLSHSPAVSIVMPVLDPDPAYFRQALACVLGQTFRDFELLIVEDPGATSAADLLAKTPDPRIRHLRNDTRTSLVRQLNRGLEAARAPLVARFDADDLCEPTRLERQLAVLAAHPEVTVVGSQITIIDEGGRPLGRYAYPLDHAAIVAALRRSNPFSHPSIVMRKDAILAAGGYRYDRYPVEDYELWCRLAQRGARFANLPDVLVHYRVHAGATKSRKLRDTLRGLLAVKWEYWDGRLGWGDRAVMAVERLCLLLPPRIVLRLMRARWQRTAAPQFSARPVWSGHAGVL